jgi:hypothetical protein
MNTAYFEWKYEHKPYMDTPLIYMALYAGKEVVGMMGTKGANWQINQPCQISLRLRADDSVIYIIVSKKAISICES